LKSFFNPDKPTGFSFPANTYHVRLRNRRRGVTYIEIVVAMSFVLICTATLTNSLSFSTQMIDYSQRRVLVQANLQSTIDEIKSGALTALPSDGTSNYTFTLPGSRTVTVTRTFTREVGKNITRIQISASWPEVRGTRSFNDTMSFELYLRGPDV
jgi:type II secretory pathway pseudopilin PulG